ncbi:MAG: hypothetical protein M3011_08825 [Actinomycetota bacterium]|nr:hypothetical protein [Actinomycetota bacterium]
MTDPRLEDHVVGLELQLVELVEQQHRAETQYRPDDAARLAREIAAVQQELAASAEAAAQGVDQAPPSEHADVLAPTVEQFVNERPAPSR